MIPRRKGEFYWRQFAIFRELGIRTVFVGMFDEVDEGTAIYKVANQTPVGKYFVDLRRTALRLVPEADRRRDPDDPRRRPAIRNDTGQAARSEEMTSWRLRRGGADESSLRWASMMDAAHRIPGSVRQTVRINDSGRTSSRPAATVRSVPRSVAAWSSSVG